MAFNVKAFGMASALMGGCIGLPWYLLQTGKGSSLITQTSVQSVPETVSMSTEDTKSTEKVSCRMSDASQVSQHLQSFPQDKSEIYSSVSCENATVKGDYSSLLGRNWSGLFPKDVLSQKLQLKDESTFEVGVETWREEGMDGTSAWISFNNPKTDGSVRGKLGDIKEESSSKKSVVVSLEGVGQAPKEVYLLVDPKN